MPSSSDSRRSDRSRAAELQQAADKTKEALPAMRKQAGANHEALNAIEELLDIVADRDDQ
ncbi:hypothetical protein M8C13_07540 [Crossiella sp. SN42]|uniref:hypothetical protein n=1 Tax=Crossiella sp. SN42 TaxID=2944808 RepID=UPI00207C7DCD|nr:hypothetical protein [Crossiella sp. SN42]MCO1575610.1 hypothetical protein [Crossiella sp. SN42]